MNINHRIKAPKLEIINFTNRNVSCAFSILFTSKQIILWLGRINYIVTSNLKLQIAIKQNLFIHQCSSAVRSNAIFNLGFILPNRVFNFFHFPNKISNMSRQFATV